MATSLREEKLNSDVKLCLKINCVSHPACDGGVGWIHTCDYIKIRYNLPIIPRHNISYSFPIVPNYLIIHSSINDYQDDEKTNLFNGK